MVYIRVHTILNCYDKEETPTKKLINGAISAGFEHMKKRKHETHSRDSVGCRNSRKSTARYSKIQNEGKKEDQKAECRLASSSRLSPVPKTAKRP